MKLIHCETCHDVVKLDKEMRFCKCGKVYGRYINNVEAEVSKTAVSIAIGNGSLDMAVAAMRERQLFTNDLADRQDYQSSAKIHYAWVRPNSGKGNPHTKICEQDIRPVVFVDLKLLVQTNTTLNEEVVAAIAAEGWQQEKGKAIPAWRNGGKWYPTDGNHRIEALKRLGQRYAPVVELTREEFDHVKYSKNSVDFLVHVPDYPLIYTSK